MIFRPQIKKLQGRVIVPLDMIIGIDTPALPVPASCPVLWKECIIEMILGICQT
jgi:hypothetical protein